MELELGLALPNHNPMMNQDTDNRKDCSKKRVFRRQLEAEDDGGRRPSKWRRFIHIIDDDDECEEMEAMKSHAAVIVRKSMHVKVKMEGVVIGRKLDLRGCHSYHDLTNILIDMFAKYTKIERRREEYTLLYQDKDGDWMLVGDVQWEAFVESVQRIEILKNHNKMGFRLLSRNI